MIDLSPLFFCRLMVVAATCGNSVFVTSSPSSIAIRDILCLRRFIGVADWLMSLAIMLTNINQYINYIRECRNPLGGPLSTADFFMQIVWFSGATCLISIGTPHPFHGFYTYHSDLLASHGRGLSWSQLAVTSGGKIDETKFKVETNSNKQTSQVFVVLWWSFTSARPEVTRFQVIYVIDCNRFHGCVWEWGPPKWPVSDEIGDILCSEKPGVDGGSSPRCVTNCELKSQAFLVPWPCTFSISGQYPRRFEYLTQIRIMDYS